MPSWQVNGYLNFQDLVAIRIAAGSSLYPVVQVNQFIHGTGMFAVKVNQRRDLVQGLTRALITLGTGRQQFLDQILLSKVFWPTVKDDAVIYSFDLMSLSQQ